MFDKESINDDNFDAPYICWICVHLLLFMVDFEDSVGIGHYAGLDGWMNPVSLNTNLVKFASEALTRN